MGRRFTSGTSSRITCTTAADLAGLNWRFGTMACVIYRSADTGGYETVMATQNGATDMNAFQINGTDNWAVFDNPTERSTGAGTITVPVTTSVLLGWTKTTGGTPRGHKYTFNTNTWIHAVGTGASADAGTTSSLQIGTHTTAGFEFISSEIFALGLWQGWNATDSEFERLARGRWLEQGPIGPDFYQEFTAHQEGPVDMVRSLGRNRTRQTARTATTRGVMPLPPGFRGAAARRRR